MKPTNLFNIFGGTQQPLRLWAKDGTGAAFVVQATPESAEILSQESGVACGVVVDVTPMGVLVGGHATRPIVAPDTDEDRPNRQSTLLAMKGKRLFQSPSDKVNRSAPAKHGKSTSSPANTRKYKATYAMDFNRSETLLFNFLFSDGHLMEDTLVRKLQYRLTRREIQSLIPGRPIDGAVVEMVAMRNACSIHHLKHPYFWCLPPSFADNVSKGLSVMELNEIYVPFWLKPTRFLNRVCVSIHTDFLAFRITFGAADPIGTNLEEDRLAPRLLPGREYGQRPRAAYGTHARNVVRDDDFSGVWTPATVHSRRHGSVANMARKWDTKLQYQVHLVFSAAWVIQWLHREGSFNPLSILHSAAERPCPLRVDPLTQSVAWLGCGQLSGSDDVRREIIFLSGQTCGRNGRADGGLGKHLLVDKIRFCGTAT
ncbi:uncharacterized protein DS421_13g422790 [Arachis hypogaea]|nr:uncharacterized protein DS421_13g422790 [Arachis hypogaea]